MRSDAAFILISLGYRPEVDFRAGELPGGDVVVTWLNGGTPPTEAQINAAALDAYRARKIASINAECRSRLLARYGPAEEQVSRSLGIYGAAEKTAMETGIAATIDASNTGSNSVLAAANEAAVEAVSVSWPVI